MSTTRSRLISTAHAELGIRESPANSNRVKYSVEYGLIGPWCSMFVWWSALHSGAGDMRKLVTAGFASCEAARDSLKKMGCIRPSRQLAQVGDVVYFDWNGDGHVDHTGLVVATASNGLVCIEGNTSATNGGSQSNGGMVAQRFRPWSVIASVGFLPNVLDDTSVKAPPAVTPPPPPAPTPGAAEALKKLADELAFCKLFVIGDNNNTSETAVRFVQWGLNASKVAGVLQPDGIWGPATRSALIHFQSVRHLNPDGLVGPATWHSLYP